MIYLVILFIFNLVMIVILSNVKRPSFNKLSKYKITPVMMLKNIDVPLSEIDINKYHSIFIASNKIIEDDGNND